MKKIIAVVGISAVTALPVFAESGAYLGGKFGSTAVNNACDSQATCDDTNGGVGLIAGYDFTDWLALEAGYDYFGNMDTNFGSQTFQDTLTSLTLAPKLSFALNEGMDLYGKLGAAQWDYSSFSDVSMLAAVGMSMAISPSLDLRMEYQHIEDMSDSVFNGVDSSFLGFGFNYNFGRSKPAVVTEPVPVVMPEPVVEEKPVETVVAAKTFSFTEKNGVGLFQTGKATLAQSSLSRLDELVTLLVTYPQATVNISGHTDSTGSSSFNQKLSEQRANSVANYLIEKGVEPARITAVGEGETRPVASNDTLEGRQSNRRVEVNVPTFTYTE